MIEDLDLGPAQVRRFQRIQNRAPLHLVDRHVQAIGVILGSGDELEQPGEQVAGQPGVGGVAGLVEHQPGKPSRERLRRNGAAIEVDVVGDSVQGLRVDLNGGGRLSVRAPGAPYMGMTR
jgi:hypothetical protein